MNLEYRSSLSTRYSSKFMSLLFSEKERASMFRHLWVILAQIEKQLGLKISDEALLEMKQHIHDIDLERIKELEDIYHHDVMAHIEAFAEKAPSARGIIHLGSTSCFATDNADVLIYKKGLDHLIKQFKDVLEELMELAWTHKNTVCVGYTHFQVAQPTTMGKRFCLWLQDLYHLYVKLDQFRMNIKLLGLKGATGSQSSFYTLFEGDLDKIKKMEELFEEKLGMKCVDISGQTYTRLQDAELIHIFSEIAAAFHKMGTDIRLLSHTGELQESFSKTQVGSSAMPHKKNPMLSERLCSLSRFLMQQSVGSLETYANQWLERTLDDSAIRRLIMPESFLTLDALFKISTKIVKKLHVDIARCKQIMDSSVVSLSLEPILMYLALQGYDRQKTHKLLKNLYNAHSGSLEAFLNTLESEEGIVIDQEFRNKLQDPLFYVKVCAIQVEELIYQKIKPNL